MPARRLLSSLEVKRAFNREECFGFPTGITGHALADRAFVQAQKFGAHTGIPCEDTCGISIDNNGFVRTGKDLHDANMLSTSSQTSVEGISPMAIFAWGRPGVSRRQWVKARVWWRRSRAFCPAFIERTCSVQRNNGKDKVETRRQPARLLPNTSTVTLRSIRDLRTEVHRLHPIVCIRADRAFDLVAHTGNSAAERTQFVMATRR